jgi:hypothetical protein
MTRLGLVGGSASRGGRCLGDLLTAYADRAMDAVSLLHWDRHLVACARCRALVDQERRVLGALRAPSASTVPSDLRSLLLAVADQPLGPGAPTSGTTGSRTRGWPQVHVAPPVPVAPVPVVDRDAPALHRSVRRATVFAGIAAGATAAAAWGLAVTGGSGVPAPTTPVSPAVQRARSAQPGFATAAFTVRGLGSSTNAGVSARPVGPTVSGARQRWAESTP